MITRRQRDRKMDRLLLIFCVFTISAVDLLSACGPSGAVPIQERRCASDLECSVGFFCYSQFDGSSSCLPCTDCSKWNRGLQPGRECPQTKHECGKCIAGYEDDDNQYCVMTKITKQLEEKKNGNNAVSDPTKAGSNTWIYIGIGVLVLIMISSTTGLVVKRYRKRRRHLSGVGDNIPLNSLKNAHDNGNDGVPTAPNEYSQPPPYHEISRQRTVVANVAVVNENCQQARPYHPGTSFGEATAQYWNPQQELAIENQVNNDESFYDDDDAMDNEGDEEMEQVNDQYDHGHLPEESMPLVGNSLEEEDHTLDDPGGQHHDHEAAGYAVALPPPSHLPLDAQLPDNNSTETNHNASEPRDDQRLDDADIMQLQVEFNVQFRWSFRSDNPENPQRNLCSASLVNNNESNNNSSLSLDQNDSGISNSNSPPQSPGGPPPPPSEEIVPVMEITTTTNERHGTAFLLQPHYHELSASQPDMSLLLQEYVNGDEGFDGAGDLFQQVG